MTRRLMTTIFTAAAVLVAGLALVPAGAANAAPDARPSAVRAKAQKPFFAGCKKTGRFNERRFDFDLDAVLAGRCVTSRVKGVDLVSSYSGHHPSAQKALDVMVNMKGSCKAGRTTGNVAARYFMNNAKKHKVRYIIWKNAYWSSDRRPTKWRNWRHGMHSGSCTTRHFDHVHVAFK